MNKIVAMVFGIMLLIPSIACASYTYAIDSVYNNSDGIELLDVEAELVADNTYSITLAAKATREDFLGGQILVPTGGLALFIDWDGGIVPPTALPGDPGFDFNEYDLELYGQADDVQTVWNGIVITDRIYSLTGDITVPTGFIGGQSVSAMASFDRLLQEPDGIWGFFEHDPTNANDWYCNGEATTFFTVKSVPVPEPASMLFLGLGSLGLLGMRRFRSK